MKRNLKEANNEPSKRFAALDHPMPSTTSGTTQPFNMSSYYPSLVQMIDPASAYAAIYNSAAATGWTPFNQQSHVMFNPSRPPPPLPLMSKPPPPPLPQNPPPPLPSPPQQRMLSHGVRRGSVRGGLFPRIRHPFIRPPTSPSTTSSQLTPSPSPATSISTTASSEIDLDSLDDPHVQVNKKAKRKPMSTRYTRKREWNRDDAVKAIALEREHSRIQKTPMLILKFPDPELSKEIVKKYSPSIETVHFQQPSTPRYCFVQLKEGSNIDQVRDQISKIPFGTGHIFVEKKNQNNDENQVVEPEEIDPYTLYIGNLPTTVTVGVVKEKFPTAHRIDIGYAQRMKYTRYAFVRYHTIEEAMDAYKETFNLLIDSRSLIVRFRRQKGNVGLPGESKVPNPRKLPPAKVSEYDKVENVNGSSSSDIKNSSSSSNTCSNAKNYQEIRVSKESPGEKTPEAGSSSSSNITEIFVHDTNQATPTKITSKPAEESRRLNVASNEVVDSKDGVLQEAEQILRLRSTTKENSDRVPVRKIKVEHNPDDRRTKEYSAEIEENGILGSRIKEEPIDDEFDALEDSPCFDDFEDDDLEQIEDEESDDEEYDANFEEKEEDDDDVNVYGARHWEQIRQKELSLREDKPDIELLAAALNNKSDNKKSTKSTKEKENSNEDQDDLDELYQNINSYLEDDFDFSRD